MPTDRAQTTLPILCLALLFSAGPALGEETMTPGGEALLFGSQGLPLLLGWNDGADLALQVIGDGNAVLGAAKVPGCSLMKLRLDLAGRSTGCLPRKLLEEHGLSRFPIPSPLCSDLTAAVEVIPEGLRMRVRLLLSGGERSLEDQTLTKRGPFPVSVRWHEGCGLVVVSHAGTDLSRPFTRVEALPGDRGRIPGPARGAFWLRLGERSWEEGEWTQARDAAGAALPLVQTTADLTRTSLLLARVGLHRDALDAAAGVAAKDAAAGAALLATADLREARLSTLDLASRDLSFKASKGFEGTTIWVKIKDSKDENIAVFKPTSGNTYHRGEVFTWRMARLLGIEDLYPVTVLTTLDKKGCDRLVSVLQEVTYKGPKEVNRQRIIRECRDGELEGAVKEWVKGFVFFGGIGTVKRLKGHAIYRYLTRGGPRPEHGTGVPVTQKTRLYKPDNCKEATYKGILDQDLLARDLSDLLVMDVLNANEDRFPGANVEFKSISGKVAEPKPCTFDLGPARLFSLDNGGTFKGAAYRSWDDLAKHLRISRFNRRTFLRLKALQAFITGGRGAPIFVRRVGVQTVEDLWRYLAMDRPDSHRNRKKPPFNLFRISLKKIVNYMTKLQDDRYAWF